MTAPVPLARRLGLRDAVVIGLASMIGAGVFAVWGPAARAGGDWLLLGLALAAFVAYANATSTGRLAARYPEAGGAYRFGREELGAWPGFLAGWGFVVGKTASCAAMAMTAAAYLVPLDWQKPAAIGAVAVLSALNLLGITRTARAATVIVAAVLLVLGVVVAAGLAGLVAGDAAPLAAPPAGPYGVLQSAGLLFFAFAGYARIATLGEEVRAPARTIPRAIAIALGLVVVLYALLALVLLQVLGAGGLAAGDAAPLAALVVAGGWEWAAPVVGVGAGLAALGALLALIAGIGRTALAMARDGELPRQLAAVHPRTQVPYLAELVVAAAIVVVLLLADLRGAIGFSSFGVLVYYLVANLAALRLDAAPSAAGGATGSPAARRGRRGLAIAGAVGCTVLVATLPPLAVAGGVAVFALGALVRGIRLRLARPAP